MSKYVGSNATEEHVSVLMMKASSCNTVIGYFPPCLACVNVDLPDPVTPNTPNVCFSFNSIFFASSTEVATVISYINRYNLKQYDNVDFTRPERDNPYTIPAKVLRRGDKNDQVKWLQYELNNEWGYQLAVDGSYGKKTKAAVMDFQKNRGLVVDGICGPKTLKSLGVII